MRPKLRTWLRRWDLWLSPRQPQVLLVLAALQGLLFLCLLPPWQHYDEPTHFEYAWPIAHRHALPALGSYDPAMRREVAGSMLAHQFY